MQLEFSPVILPEPQSDIHNSLKGDLQMFHHLNNSHESKNAVFKTKQHCAP